MITTILIVITTSISYLAYSNQHLMDALIFYPPAIQRKQWYRLFSYGFLHANLPHLIFNMIALYLFGKQIETVFVDVFGQSQGILFYLVFYFTALFFSILPTWFKQKDNAYYKSLGASGAVSSIVFAYILIYPMSFMGVMFIPVFLPAFIFGIIYIVASFYFDKKQQANINHLAHIAGAVYGVIFIFVLFQLQADINIGEHFISSIQIYSVSDIIKFGY